MSADILNIVLVAAAIVILGLIFWLSRLEIRFRRLMAGKRANNLEGIIVEMAEEIDRVNNDHDQTKKTLRQLEDGLKQSVRHVRTLRFNPFHGEGGNQSFTTALLNDHGHGVVISGLYTRGQVNVYAKPIKNRQSEHELTEEEKTVLELSA